MMLMALLLCLAAGLLAQTPPTAPMPAPPGHKLDWPHYAVVRAAPYLDNIDDAADGNPSTAAEYQGGPETGGWIEWRFPRSVEITAIRFIQAWPPAETYQLRTDTTGKYRYETVVATHTDDAPVSGAWITLPVNKTVRGLKLVAMRGQAGYRTPYPSGFQEIEIYTRREIAPARATSEKPGSLVTPGNALAFPPLTKRQIRFTPCIDLWMAGINPGATMPDTTEQVEQSAGFQTMLQQLREIDATGVRIFPETYCALNKMPWVSKLAPNYGKNTLPAMIAALHHNGLTVDIFMHAWMSPFQQEDRMLPMPDRRWDYPYEQSDLLRSKGVKDYRGNYPCVICDDDFGAKWFGLLKEVVDMGVDGVYMMPDEYYYKGHDLATVKCPSCEREFKKRFGYDSLPKPGAAGEVHRDAGTDPRKAIDTEQYRKYKLFEYERIARLFDDVAGKLQQINPKLELISSANPAGELMYNLRLEHGCSIDEIGRGTHFTAVSSGKRQQGANPGLEYLGGIQALNFNSLQANKQNEILFYGTLLPAIMSGSTKETLYRLNYVQENGWWPRVQQGMKAVRLLEQWGVVGSIMPADTCLLVSRASEDWWQIKAQSVMGNAEPDSKRSTILYMEQELGTVETEALDETERALNFERFRGRYSAHSMESLLDTGGIQYDIRYTEREDTLNDLQKYRLLILPFSYSMSREAYDNIRKAVDAGTRLLILNQLAPTDEYGTAYPEPLLKSLLGHPNVTYLETNLAADGMRRDVQAALCKQLDRQLAGNGYYFNNNGGRVEYLIRRVGPRTVLLYLANRSSQPETPVLGVPLTAGAYAATLYSTDTNELREGAINGRTIAGANDFQRFGITLTPGEVMLVRIAPAE